MGCATPKNTTQPQLFTHTHAHTHTHTHIYIYIYNQFILVVTFTVIFYVEKRLQKSFKFDFFKFVLQTIDFKQNTDFVFDIADDNS